MTYRFAVIAETRGPTTTTRATRRDETHAHVTRLGLRGEPARVEFAEFARFVDTEEHARRRSYAPASDDRPVAFDGQFARTALGAKLRVYNPEWRGPSRESRLAQRGVESNFEAKATAGEREKSYEIVGTGVEQGAIDDRVVDEIEKLRITGHTRAARIPSSREHRFGNRVASHDNLVDTLLEAVVRASGVRHGHRLYPRHSCRHWTLFVVAPSVKRPGTVL
jgi:hypothetical protein